MPHPDDPEPGPADELRERIAETRRAAERLAGEVPRNGWATPKVAGEHQDELQALASLVAALRDLVPPELCEQVNDVLRAVLLLLRAVIDWLTDQLAREPPSAPQRAVQDIPIA